MELQGRTDKAPQSHGKSGATPGHHSTRQQQGPEVDAQHSLASADSHQAAPMAAPDEAAKPAAAVAAAAAAAAADRGGASGTMGAIMRMKAQHAVQILPVGASCMRGTS